MGEGAEGVALVLALEVVGRTIVVGLVLPGHEFVPLDEVVERVSADETGAPDPIETVRQSRHPEVGKTPFRNRGGPETPAQISAKRAGTVVA